MVFWSTPNWQCKLPLTRHLDYPAFCLLFACFPSTTASLLHSSLPPNSSSASPSPNRPRVLPAPPNSDGRSSNPDDTAASTTPSKAPSNAPPLPSRQEEERCAVKTIESVQAAVQSAATFQVVGGGAQSLRFQRPQRQPSPWHAKEGRRLPSQRQREEEASLHDQGAVESQIGHRRQGHGQG